MCPLQFLAFVGSHHRVIHAACCFMTAALLSLPCPGAESVTSQFTITRDFANNSGGEVTVREIGLVVKLATTLYFLTIRDAVNIAIPNGETLTVNYRIQATV